MKFEYKGYIIQDPRSSGGKAGRGKNRTSNVQVKKDGLVKKQFKYDLGKQEWKDAAIECAKEWIDRINDPLTQQVIDAIMMGSPTSNGVGILEQIHSKPIKILEKDHVMIDSLENMIEVITSLPRVKTLGIKDLGNGLFSINDSIITGEGGVKAFNDALKTRGEAIINGTDSGHTEPGADTGTNGEAAI